MFSKATANFVRQIDPDGSLIHVSRVNDSRKLVPMALVVKRKRIWIWQRPKYQPTSFILNHLLLGDKELNPGVCETDDFVTYKGTFGDNVSGELNAKTAPVNVKLEGQGTSELRSCFGKLKKQELDVEELLHDSSNRQVDMQHVLVQQVKKRNDVLALVTERILTTSSCPISQKKKEHCIFQGVLSLVGLLGSFVKGRNNIEIDSNVSIEIPADTVIAYSILELEIKKSGHFGICLQPGTVGGFEADSSAISSAPSDSIYTVVDGKHNGDDVPEEVNLNAPQNGSQEMDLSPLAELPLSTQHALLKKLQDTMKDKTALSYLECVLEELCTGDSLQMDEQEKLCASQRESASAMLDGSGSDGHTECSQPANAALLNAVHLLVSAMEELPDETLRLLSESKSDFLEAFDELVHPFRQMSMSRGPLPIHRLPVLLQDNQAFQQAEQLLCSIDVKLKRNIDGLWLENSNGAGNLPLLLFLSTHGLSVLCSGLK